MPHNQKKELMEIRARNFKGQGVMGMVGGLAVFFAIVLLGFWIVSLFINIPILSNTAAISFMNNARATIDNSIIFIALVMAVILLIVTYEHPSMGKAIMGIIFLFMFGYLSIVLGLLTNIITNVFPAGQLFPQFSLLMNSDWLIALVFFLGGLEIILNFRKPNSQNRKVIMYESSE